MTARLLIALTFVVLPAAATAAAAAAIAAIAPRVALEPAQQLSVPAGWVRAPRAPDASTAIVFALRLDSARLAHELDAVSDPSSPRYGRHLSLSEVDALTAPPAAAVAAVEAFVAAHGGQACAWTKGTGFARCPLPVSSVETMLETPFEAFVHPRVPAVVYRAVTKLYTVPAGLAFRVFCFAMFWS